MHARLQRGLAALLILLAPVLLAPAVAMAKPGQSKALTPLLPTRGAYYDATKPGTGASVDVGQDGFVFLTYYSYDTLGVPTWYIIQGQWTPSSEAQRVETDTIGTLASPLLYATGGQCVSCDFTHGPSVIAEQYSVSASWTTPRHLDLSIGNQTWHMDAVRYGATNQDVIAGTWQLSISWDASADADPTGLGIASHTQVVKIEPGRPFGGPPLAVTVELDPNADSSIALPPQGSQYYAIDSSNPCAPGPVRIGNFGVAFTDIFSAIQPSILFANSSSAFQYLAPMLWYAPSKERGGLDVVTQTMGIDTVPLALGPNNIHFDLYFEPDRIIGHGVVQGKNLKNVPAGYWQPDTVSLNLLMQRLPDDLVERSIYVCRLY